jgi:ribosomal 50S subunit-recycling heat shock protein
LSQRRGAARAMAASGRMHLAGCPAKRSRIVRSGSNVSVPLKSAGNRSTACASVSCGLLST